MVLLLSGVFAFAQSDDENQPKRVDFYGYVVTADSLKPIRNTHVISKMAHCGTISNQYGHFHIQARQVDTLWVSCVGYARRLIAIDEKLTSADTLVIRLYPETITLREVTVLPFAPVGNGMPTITANPIQYLYDKYNASARRQNTLRRNRRMYNEVLREQGRTDELLPDSLDFSVEYKMPYDDKESLNPKALVPRKKYIRIGQ